MKKIAILGAKRTPIGAFQGQFKEVPAPRLGGIAIQAAVEQAGVDPRKVGACVMGNVLAAGVGMAPARQAAVYGGLPESAVCSTISKVCGSGMRSVMIGADMLRLGQHDFVVAGGMESMTLAPYLLPAARSGMRMGHDRAVDSMIHDGLWDPYENVHVGGCGEILAERYEFTREMQDAFALESLKRAQKAVADGTFREEIAPVEVQSRKGTAVFDTDEQPGLGKPDKIPSLRPVFKKDGTITPANASSINDGAAALVLATEEAVKEHGLEPLAWIEEYAEHAMEPKMFTLAPVHAVEKLLKKTGKRVEDVELWEVNEAFAVVAMAVLKDHSIDRGRLNVFGGACALGHPIGCSGTRIIVTLINALKKHGRRSGLASLCIGGGEATAMTVELA